MFKSPFGLKRKHATIPIVLGLFVLKVLFKSVLWTYFLHLCILKIKLYIKIKIL